MRKARLVMAGLAVLLTVAEAAIVRDAHHPPGVFAAFGVVACLLLIVVAKGLARIGLQRPEPPDE